MTDEVVVPQAEEAEALALGWVPEDKFKGDKAKWVDAKTFVERGHSVMPILKQNNEKLLGKLEVLQRELAELRDADKAKGQTISDLTKFQAAEVKRQVESTLKTLKVQRDAARKNGDDDLADELTDQIAEVKATPAPSPTPAAPPPPTTPVIEPWAKEFAEANPWLGVDKRRTGLFMIECDTLYATGLRGTALLNAAKAEVIKVFDPVKEPGASKTEGGGGSPSGGGGGRATGKTFADLPPDAKAVCATEAKKFVGANKAFKSEAEWQKHYATVFFESE